MPEENEVILYDYIKVISKRKWLIIAGTFAFILSAAIVTFLLPKVYETQATLAMEGSETPQVKIGILTIPTGLSLVKFFDFLPHNRDLALAVIQKVGLDKSPHNLTPQALSQMISFSLTEKSRMITIKVRYRHPEKTKDIANTMAEVVKNHYQVLNEAEVSQCQSLIDEQLSLVQASLVEVEKNLEVFKETVDVNSLRKEIQTRSSKEIKLTEEYSKIRVSLVEQEARLARAEEELQKQDRFYVVSKSMVGDPAYKEILDKLSKEDISALGAVKTENQQINPVYINLEQTVTNARISIAGAKARELLLKTEIEENGLVLSKLRTQLAEKEPEWGSLTEAYNRAKKDYLSIGDTHRGTEKLLAVARARRLKTVSTAGVPATSIEPKTKRILLMAAVLGLLVALFLAFFVEYLEKMRRLEAQSNRQRD